MLLGFWAFFVPVRLNQIQLVDDTVMEVLGLSREYTQKGWCIQEEGDAEPHIQRPGEEMPWVN